MCEKTNAFEIKAEERQSWGSIAMVWIGSMICVPSLMVGGILGTSLTIPQIIAAIVIGYGIICFYMSLMGIQGCDTGLPTSNLAAASLGEKGARYIISTILAVACIGWFGIQSGVCGSSFSSMIATITGIEIPVWLSSLIWGMIMLVTACGGFKGLKLLNYVAVPLLLIVCGYGAIAAMNQFNGTETLQNYVPVTPIPFVSGVSLVVATFAIGGAISGDYCRYAKNRADVIKSSVIGVLPSGLMILMVGAIMSVVTGEYDISVVLAKIGVPVIGLVALVLATWTTNVTNAYSGGLSLSNLLGAGEKRFVASTAIAGFLGTILAIFGILDKFQAFLSLLSAFVPALVGVVIADYWLLGGGKKENFRIREGFHIIGIIAFTAGALIACITGGTFASFPALTAAAPFLNVPFFIGPLNGIAVSIVLYLVLSKIAPQNVALTA